MLAHKRFLTNFLGTMLSVRRFGELTRFFNFYNFTWEIMVTIFLLLITWRAMVAGANLEIKLSGELFQVSKTKFRQISYI